MSRPTEYEFSGTTKVRAIQRASGACEECGAKGVYIEVHHLLGIYYATNFFPQLAPWIVASLDNAKVLCKPCHNEYDAKQKQEYTYYAARLLGYLEDSIERK